MLLCHFLPNEWFLGALIYEINNNLQKTWVYLLKIEGFFTYILSLITIVCVCVRWHAFYAYFYIKRISAARHEISMASSMSYRLCNLLVFGLACKTIIIYYYSTFQVDIFILKYKSTAESLSFARQFILQRESYSWIRLSSACHDHF